MHEYEPHEKSAPIYLLIETEYDGESGWNPIGGHQGKLLDRMHVAFVLAEMDRVKRDVLSGAEAAEVALRNGVVPRNVHGAEMGAEDALAVAADKSYARLDVEQKFRVRGKARKLLLASASE